MKGIAILVLSTSACLMAASPLLASSQGMEIMRETVVFAGEMHGAESRCKDCDKAKLDEIRRAQKQRARETGLSSADFEAAWALGYEDARQKMGSLSEPERVAVCNRPRSEAGMRPQPRTWTSLPARPIDQAAVASATIAPNLLDRTCAAAALNRNWVVDFTHLWTAEGRFYAAVVLDLYSRRVIG